MATGRVHISPSVRGLCFARTRPGTIAPGPCQHHPQKTGGGVGQRALGCVTIGKIRRSSCDIVSKSQAGPHGQLAKS